jgi:hypothetical protein
MATKNNKKVTSPLVITHFNSVLSFIVVSLILCLIADMQHWSAAVVVCIHTTFWFSVSAGILLCLGYLAAILDRNVIVVNNKQKDNK